MANKPETIVISNFGGRLTRILNGDLNSGFAKFNTSFGYDPFTKPMNLTWFEQPRSVAGIDTLIMGGINRAATIVGALQEVYVVGSTGKVYYIGVNNPATNNPNLDSVMAITSVGVAFTYGAGLEFFGQTQKLYLGGDNNVVATGSVTSNQGFVLDGSRQLITDSSLMGLFSPHPLKKFAGKLIFGNGATIGAIDSTATVISSVFTIANPVGNQYSQLSPPLPVDQKVRDLDVSVDGNYLNISATNVQPELLILDNVDMAYAAPGQGAVYGWNGVDQGVTTALTIPAGTATSLQTYLQDNMVFLNDTFGAALSDMNKKILSLPGNKSPLPNATSSNGNFLTWACPEETDRGAHRVASLYYFGSLDQENPVGLYRLLRYNPPTTEAKNFVFQVPYNAVVSNAYRTLNPTKSSVESATYGKHYFSVSKTNIILNSRDFMRFNVTSEGTGAPQLGVYETQTQLFSKRVQIAQVRVYTEPTVAGNGFQLDIIGADGNVISNGTFNYSFAAGSDETRLQGALQRINFNPALDAGFAFGIRLTNTGTTNMTIKKVEIDWTPQGR